MPRPGKYVRLNSHNEESDCSGVESDASCHPSPQSSFDDLDSSYSNGYTNNFGTSRRESTGEGCLTKPNQSSEARAKKGFQTRNDVTPSNTEMVTLESSIPDREKGINQVVNSPPQNDPIEKFGNWLSEALAAFQKGQMPPAFTNNSQNECVRQSSSSPLGRVQNIPEETSSVASKVSNSIRWDHVRRFPDNVPANRMWESWCRFYQNFEMAASLGNANSPKQRAQLLYISLSEQLQGIVNAFYLMPNLADPSCYDEFVKNIERHLLSMTDTSAEHDSFQSMRQGIDESVVTFHSRLVEKVRLCGYSIEDQQKFVRTQLLKGITNREVAKFARISGSDVNFIVQSATREEAANLDAGPSNSAFAIDRRNNPPSRQPLKRSRRYQEGSRNSAPRNFSRYNETSEPSQRSRCSNCNNVNHRFGVCPAFGAICKRCGKKNHYARCCPDRRPSTIKSIEKPYEVPEKKESEQNVYTLSLNDVLVECSLGCSGPVEFLIDSGADVNIIAGKDWVRLKNEMDLNRAELQMIDHSRFSEIKAYATEVPLALECAFSAMVDVIGHRKPKIRANFLVVQEGRRSILGRASASDLRLLEVGTMVNNCESQPKLESFPKIPGVKISFSIDRNVPPVRNAYYNVPAALRDGARKRLAEMESRGIIEKVLKAPKWISGMSAVPKGKNDFRLVVNMRAPNKAINREYFRLPLLDEMKVKLHGSKFFSKLDLSNAFYHLELDDESRELTTFLSEGGMYRFTRLMFGVNCAPEVFQKEMTRILEAIPNVIVYIDDILIFGTTLPDLRSTVDRVLEVLDKNNLTLNHEKCEFDKSEIKFLGHLLNENGFHIDNDKVKSIREFREPASASELRSFLGLASFLSPHIKNFSEISHDLWAVATTKTWSWGPIQIKAFNEVKDSIIKCTTTLGYFSNSDHTILYTDASPNALGAVLVQEDANKVARVISFASKALTETEKRYPQNQREALGAVWGVERFSFFLFGRHFTLRTDAQGVAFVLNRSRENSKRALTRADGWALRLSPYSYKIEYIRGRENIADPSSRLYNGKDGPFEEDISPWEVASISFNTSGFLTESQIRDATSSDEILRKVLVSLDTENWPPELRSYEAIADDLSVQNGIIIKRGCAVIPKSLQNLTLNVAHKGHPMASKMRSILRERVWWPGITSDVEKWVQTCQLCATCGRPEKPTPMKRLFTPKNVWQTIALDFNGPYANIGGISILVCVDYRSRYLIARPVKSTSFDHTKKVLDDIFNKEGFPENIKTDNGPPFNGQEYKDYCTERGINLIYSTPYYPQQNGLVEGYMKIINKAMAAAFSNGTDYMDELQAAVQAHNSAKHTVTQVPPEEVLMRRKIRRRLPLMRPGKARFRDKAIDKRDRNEKLKGKALADSRRSARKCRVKVGDIVILERPIKAKGETRFHPNKFTVIEEHNGNLILEDKDGTTVRRHVSQTRRVHEWKAFEHKLPGTEYQESESSDQVPEIPNYNPQITREL
ncbi:uncharacterized protein K02A2.6-like [Uranotaenia lowii]|uniref:uncharacterized protein K02A2.6-like n=1 Tax=Uranotaenia lowii TaxID=190385 RepID=UPI002479F2B5|nr:uncharacterized protein K02A2.6-like [Uranotaenia lowii]